MAQEGGLSVTDLAKGAHEGAFARRRCTSILPYIIRTVATKCVATRGGYCRKIPVSRHPSNSSQAEQKVALRNYSNKIGLLLLRVRDASAATNF